MDLKEKVLTENWIETIVKNQLIMIIKMRIYMLATESKIILIKINEILFRKKIEILNLFISC
jgi:hypothetical protein